MDMVQELQILRAELIKEIDDKIGEMLTRLRAEQEAQAQGDAADVYETIVSLGAGAGLFKGRRPTGILFPDGTREDVPTWKRVVEEVLRHCCEQPDRRQALMELRGKVLGRNRVLLGSSARGMRSPLKIDRGLYMESHYDAESLIRILTTRILDAVGYDYSQIRIAIQND